MGKVGVLIECRSTSTRLPGKCYEDIAGKAMTELVYDRCMLAHGVDEVKVIVPWGDELSDWCDGAGIRCYESPAGVRTGSVLEELVQASYGYEFCVEITGDCPCIDPKIVSWVVRWFKANQPLDFCGWLEQKGCEVRCFRPKSIERAACLLRGYERDGTTIFYQPPDFDIFTLQLSEKIPGVGLYDLSVDTKEDLEFIRSIYKEVPWDAPLATILEAAQRIRPISGSANASSAAAASTS